MNASFVQLLIFGIVAASANVLGGLILFPPGIHKNLKKVLKYILALGAGFMLSVVFIDVLPEVIKLWQSKENVFDSEALIYPMILLLVGYLLTQFFEHTIAPHFHLGVLLFYLIGTSVGFTVAYALPLASGVTLYVAASDLIPEVNHHGGKRPLISLPVFAGVALFFSSAFRFTFGSRKLEH